MGTKPKEDIIMSTNINTAFGLLEAIMDNFDAPFTASRKPITPMGVNTSETDTAVVIRYEVPGVEKQDIDLKFERGYVTMSAEKLVKQIEGETTVVTEFPYKETVSRKLKIVVPVDFQKASAKYENGILTLVLPKSEQAVASKISIL